MIELIRDILYGYGTGNKRFVLKAYVNRINSELYFHNWVDRDIDSTVIRRLKQPELNAQFGAKAAFYIADKNYQIITDNNQKNIGHNILMFPDGTFYDYKNKKNWSSPDTMYLDVYEFLINCPDVLFENILPLVQLFLKQRNFINNSKPSTIYKSEQIILKAKVQYPELLI